MQEKHQWPPHYDEETAASLDRMLGSMQPGQAICVTFFWNGCLRQIRDTFRRVDSDHRAIVMETHSIPCEAVLDIQTISTVEGSMDYGKGNCVG